MSTGPLIASEMVGGELADGMTAMAAAAGGRRDQDILPGAAYLQQVEELRGEIEDAMQAVAGNRLGVLEESLWRQQVLCTSLKHLSGALRREDATGPLMARIREATALLAEVNRTYAHLVQQSSGSTETMLRLCRTYRDGGGLHSCDGNRPAWTCEA